MQDNIYTVKQLEKYLKKNIVFKMKKCFYQYNSLVHYLHLFNNNLQIIQNSK